MQVPGAAAARIEKTATYFTCCAVIKSSFGMQEADSLSFLINNKTVVDSKQMKNTCLKPRRPRF